MEVSVLQLPTVLDAAAAQTLKGELLARRGAPVALDGSGVERMGALSLQILLAAANAWRLDSQTLSLTDPSEALCTALAQFGALERFEIGEAA